MEDRNRHRRNEDREIEPEHADEKQHQENGLEIGPLPNVANAFRETATALLRPEMPMQRLAAQQRQRRENCDKGRRIEEEYRAGADRGNQDTSHRRAEHPCRVEQRRIERDRIGKIGLADKFADEDLPRRHVEGRRAAKQKREDIDLPEPGKPGIEEKAKPERKQAHRRLRRKNKLPLVEMIGGEAG